MDPNQQSSQQNGRPTLPPSTGAAPGRPANIPPSASRPSLEDLERRHDDRQRQFYERHGRFRLPLRPDAAPGPPANLPPSASRPSASIPPNAATNAASGPSHDDLQRELYERNGGFRLPQRPDTAPGPPAYTLPSASRPSASIAANAATNAALRPSHEDLNRGFLERDSRFRLPQRTGAAPPNAAKNAASGPSHEDLNRESFERDGRFRLPQRTGAAPGPPANTCQCASRPGASIPSHAATNAASRPSHADLNQESFERNSRLTVPRRTSAAPGRPARTSALTSRPSSYIHPYAGTNAASGPSAAPNQEYFQRRVRFDLPPRPASAVRPEDDILQIRGVKSSATLIRPAAVTNAASGPSIAALNQESFQRNRRLTLPPRTASTLEQQAISSMFCSRSRAPRIPPLAATNTTSGSLPSVSPYGTTNAAPRSPAPIIPPHAATNAASGSSPTVPPYGATNAAPGPLTNIPRRSSALTAPAASLPNPLDNIPLLLPRSSGTTERTKTVHRR